MSTFGFLLLLFFLNVIVLTCKRLAMNTLQGQTHTVNSLWKYYEFINGFNTYTNNSCSPFFLLYVLHVSGDYFISNVNSILGLGTEVSRALVDSFTHGFVGYLSWAIIIDFSMFGMDMLECSGCMMLVDTDHFFASRSLQMKVRFNCIFSTLGQWKLQAPLKKKTRRDLCKLL